MLYKNPKLKYLQNLKSLGLAKEYKERHYYVKNHKNENVENPI